MKNIITVAALLAAGTACVNAAVTPWNDAPSSASGSNVASWDVSSTELTWSASNPASVVFTINLSSIDSDKSYALFSIRDITYNGLSSVGISGGNIFFENWNDSTATASTALSGFSSASDLTFVVSRDSSNNLSLTIYADGNFDSGTTLTGKTNQRFVGKTWSQLNFGGSTTSYTGNVASVMPSNENASEFTLLGAGYTKGAVVTTEELKSYYSTEIPEPSAFGLLAGVGALALVAARRRRSK